MTAAEVFQFLDYCLGGKVFAQEQRTTDEEQFVAAVFLSEESLKHYQRGYDVADYLIYRNREMETTPRYQFVKLRKTEETKFEKDIDTMSLPMRKEHMLKELALHIVRERAQAKGKQMWNETI